MEKNTNDINKIVVEHLDILRTCTQRATDLNSVSNYGEDVLNNTVVDSLSYIQDIVFGNDLFGVDFTLDIRKVLNEFVQEVSLYNYKRLNVLMNS